MAISEEKKAKAAALINGAKAKLAEATDSLNQTNLKFTDAMLEVKEKQLAALQEAHNATVAELKKEMISGKAGIDISDLIGD